MTEGRVMNRLRTIPVDTKGSKALGDLIEQAGEKPRILAPEVVETEKAKLPFRRGCELTDRNQRLEGSDCGFFGRRG